MKDNLSFYEHDNTRRPLSIVSIPIEIGSDVRGHAANPKYLFDNGLEKMLTFVGADVKESIAIPCPSVPEIVLPSKMKNVDDIATVAKRSEAAVERAAKKGNTVLALGGDHSMALGTIAGAAAAHRSMGVIYIDAHPDCNTDETTISGNVHGFVTATAMGFGPSILTDIYKRTLAPENFLYIGLKDFDQLEIEFLRANKLKTITMLDIAERGIRQAISAIDALAAKVDTVWVSMDMDSIDETDAPGVGLATPDGLTRREVMAFAHHIGKTCRLAGLDIVEMVPEKDREKKTTALAIELIARFLGGEYSWYRHYMDDYKTENANVLNESRTDC